jgi:flagella basal body P-ring formation protein FlgA
MNCRRQRQGFDALLYRKRRACVRPLQSAMHSLFRTRPRWHIGGQDLLDPAAIAMTRCLPLLLSIAATAMSNVASASTIQSLDAVREAATTFVRKRLPPSTGTYHVMAGALDPRLRLSACTQPLEAFTSSSNFASAHATVGVRCKAPQTWTVYIPVTIESEAPVLVLRHGAARGAQLSAADVELQVRRLPGVGSRYVADLTSLKGRRLKRSLPAGVPLTPDVLVQEVVVRRGQRVILLAATDHFEIRAQGIALSDGHAAERIRVQNDSSRKIVEGVVESADVVRVVAN